ncbi:S1C family serine protease [Pseudonocardia oceani]|uniref:Trypsin-like peptidase domain-containing protein n=1 Tax=Pseudonocardia oceani TaxID=2792013 RepID=A0ABS6UBD5_9PSEU|nr:trypsin-like peptidase domain-containing protein [Pseudonocardia oceani]MBW0129542.1 trypsin-like peptidase domain-containing protein [Pseudonocardia oceani]
MANDTPGSDAQGAVPDDPRAYGSPASSSPSSPADQPTGPGPQQQYGGGQPDQYGGGQYGSGRYGGQYGSGPSSSGRYAAAPHGSGGYGSQPGGYGPPTTAYGAAPGYGSGQYAQGAGQQGTGSYGAHQGAPSAPERRRGRGGLVAVGLVAALLGGGVGGAVGATLAGGGSGGSGGSSGVLGAPVPDVAESSAPVGEVEAVAARVLPSVVRLLVEGPSGAGEGSGMVLSADGLLLTNNHVVEAAASGGSIVAVFQDGSTASADLVGRDPSSDLAVIRAQNVSGLTPIELGNSDAVRVGQPVVAFGSPLGLGGSVTSGIISAVDRAVSVGEESGASEATVLSALQTDAAINPGNSGGPLTDMQGRVVGINSVIATTGDQGGSIGVGFSIPVNQARRTAQELETTGRATRAVLGAGVSRGGELSGATLVSIVPGGPAEAAGLRPGQVVTRVGDRTVSNGDDLIAAVRENAPGDQVPLIVDGQEVVVTLGGETG